MHITLSQILSRFCSLPYHTAKTKCRKFETNIPRKEYRSLSPNSHIHVSLSELYISTIGLPILLDEIWRPLLVLYKSLTDTFFPPFNTFISDFYSLSIPPLQNRLLLTEVRVLRIEIRVIIVTICVALSFNSYVTFGGAAYFTMNNVC